MKNIFKEKGLITTIIILFIMCFIVTTTYASEILIKREKKLHDNVYLNNIDIGEKNLKEVEKIIDDKVDQQENRIIKITFIYEGKAQVHNFKLKDLGYKTNKDEVVKQISSLIYNDLNPIEKVKQYVDIRKKGRRYEVIEDVEYNKFSKAINRFNLSKLPKPVDARHIYENGQIKIINEKSGVEVDRKKLYKELLASLKDNRKEFSLEIKELKAEITKEILKTQGIKERVSSFTTLFNSSNKPRSGNIRIATNIINGTIIPPGETFSFNKVVGVRTRAKGFQEAGIYINGNLDQGLGGGICQVSTTLYNAVLLADLEIVERDNHSLTVHYVPLSRDAVVSYGSKDLKFKNNTNHYIYIHSRCKENTVTFDLFSTKSNRRIELISKTIGRIDSPIKYLEDSRLIWGREYIEEEGRVGYESKLIRRIYENGKIIKEEVVSHDKYKAVPIVIRRGTMRINREYY